MPKERNGLVWQLLPKQRTMERYAGGQRAIYLLDGCFAFFPGITVA